jgi:transposase InsO family protein
MPVLWGASDDAASPASRSSDGPQASSAIDGADGVVSYLSKAPNQRSASAASGLSVPAEGFGDHAAQPYLVCGHHLYSDAPGLSVSGGDHGLGATRKTLVWRLSSTMETDFCIEALNEALVRFGRPEIFNMDQGSQFTSPRFTGVLKDAKVKISTAIA